MSDEPQTCELCQFPRPATIRYRVVPLRGVEPRTAAIRRAVMWPGAAEPAEVLTCGSTVCDGALRRIVVSILAAEAIGADVVTREVAE